MRDLEESIISFLQFSENCKYFSDVQFYEEVLAYYRAAKNVEIVVEKLRYAMSGTVQKLYVKELLDLFEEDTGNLICGN